MVIKTTRDIVGSGIILGVGGAALGGLAPSLPSGTVAPVTGIIAKGGRGLGMVTPVAFGFEALRMVDKGSRKLRRR